MLEQCFFEKHTLVCFTYAKHYASTMGQALNTTISCAMLHVPTKRIQGQMRLLTL